MLKKIIFILLFLVCLSSFSKEILLKSKYVICENNNELCDSLFLKIKTDTKDCTVYFDKKSYSFKRNKIENVIDTEKKIYESHWIDNNITYVIINMDDDGNILYYTILINSRKYFVEF